MSVFASLEMPLEVLVEMVGSEETYDDAQTTGLVVARRY